MSTFRADLKATFFGDFTWCPNFLCCFRSSKGPETTQPALTPNDSSEPRSYTPDWINNPEIFLNPNNPDFITESSKRAAVRFKTNIQLVRKVNTLKRKKLKLELANLEICSGSDMKLKFF